MSLLSIAEARAGGVGGNLDDATLQDIIDEEEQAMVELLGPHYESGVPISELHEGGYPSVFLRRRITSISSVSEAAELGDAAESLTSTDYYVWAREGRIQRLPKGATWGDAVTVSYIPVDDSARRKKVLIELLKLGLSSTGLKSENIAGEYSYTAMENHKAERAQLYASLGFQF